MLKTGEVADAERLYRESSEIKKRLLLEDFTYWRVLLDVGFDMMGVYALEDAERLFRECLSETRRLHGNDADRMDIVEVLNGLALVLLTKDELIDADARSLESLNMCRRICGDTGRNVIIWVGLFRRGQIAFHTRELEAARQLFSSALEMARWLIANEINGGNDWDVCASLHWLARIAVEENDITLAKKLCEELLTLAWKIVEKDTDDEDIAELLLVKAIVAR